MSLSENAVSQIRKLPNEYILICTVLYALVKVNLAFESPIVDREIPHNLYSTIVTDASARCGGS